MTPKTPPSVSNSKDNKDDVAAQKIIKLPLKKDTSKRADAFRHAQEIVYAVVGPEKMRFGLHMDFLCSTSPYFEAAFRGGLQEAAVGEVALPDVDVSAFERFNDWLYTGTISEEVCQDTGLSPLELYAKDTPSLPQLLDVWLLADYLLVPRLQNHAIDMMAMRMKRRKVIALADFGPVYARTEKGSPVRKLLVDMCVWSTFGNIAAIAKQTGGVVPEEMGFDLLVAMTRKSSTLNAASPLSAAGAYHAPELA